MGKLLGSLTKMTRDVRIANSLSSLTWRACQEMEQNTFCTSTEASNTNIQLLSYLVNFTAHLGI